MKVLASILFTKMFHYSHKLLHHPNRPLLLPFPTTSFSNLLLFALLLAFCCFLIDHQSISEPSLYLQALEPLTHANRAHMRGIYQKVQQFLKTFLSCPRVVLEIITRQVLVCDHAELDGLQDLITLFKLAIHDARLLNSLSGGKTLQYLDGSLIFEWVAREAHLLELAALVEEDLEESIGTISIDVTVLKGEDYSCFILCEILSQDVESLCAELIMV